MTDIRKVIKSIRHIGKQPQKDPQTMIELLIAAQKARERTVDLWENDKRIKREHNFALMKAAQEERLERIRLEKERQEEVNQTRLKNLKKGRRKLARMRENGEM
jgi:hypothetical protein